MLTTTWSRLDWRKEQTASLLPNASTDSNAHFQRPAQSRRELPPDTRQKTLISNRGQTNGNIDTGHDVFPQNGNYMLAENATSPIGCTAKVSQAYRPIGVWSRAEWVHGRKLHPPSVSKSDSGRACVCESGWAVIHHGRRPSCLMKAQNRCVITASATHSFFFSSTLSAFLVWLRCLKPERKASHQHAVTREHWMEVVFGVGTACLLVKYSRSAAWTNPGSVGENIYIHVFSKRVKKKSLLSVARLCHTICP